jgi:hypothetical protein
MAQSAPAACNQALHSTQHSGRMASAPPRAKAPHGIQYRIVLRLASEPSTCWCTEFVGGWCGSVVAAGKVSRRPADLVRFLAARNHQLQPPGARFEV